MLSKREPFEYPIAVVPGEVVICKFKIKGIKKNAGKRISIGLQCHYKTDSLGRGGSTNVICSDVESILTDISDKVYDISLLVPEFNITNIVKSVIYFTTDSFIGIDLSEINIMRKKGGTFVGGKDGGCTGIAPLVPGLVPMMVGLTDEEIRDLIFGGYRNILLREPDPGGYQYFFDKITVEGMTTEKFLEFLRDSEEFERNFGVWVTAIGNDNGVKLIDSNKEAGRPWFFGLLDTWWWNLSEEDVRKKFEDFDNNPKIAIASIVRNEAKSGNLQRFLDCCRDLEHYHNNMIYIFVEGDSIDRTYAILKTWVNSRYGSILEKLNKGNPHYPKNKNPKRTTILGELRNRLIELILSRPDITEALIIDASYGWKGDLITMLRNTRADIAAPLVVSHKDGNGNYVFYDVWTFRKNGKEFSPIYPYIDGMGMAFDSPVDIDSAGGGYLIKRSVLEAGARYDGRTDCCHVSLCNSARNMGFTVKVDPRVYIRKGGYKE